MDENELASAVVDLAIKIHKRLGPGLLESAYSSILAYELGKVGIPFEREVPLPLVWDEMIVRECYRADFIVDRKLILELKSVERLAPVHAKQLLTYLKIADLRLGLLINFGGVLMKTNIERVINGYL